MGQTTKIQSNVAANQVLNGQYKNNISVHPWDIDLKKVY